MNNFEIKRNIQRLNFIFKQIGQLSVDPEMQAHWARYLCVLVSGFIETSIRIIYTQYAKERAAKHIANFVEYYLRGFQNPKMEKILELTRMFDVSWEEELRRQTEGELKDAIDSIVTNRHKIAHGESVGITYTRIFEYYKRAIAAIELIEKQSS